MYPIRAPQSEPSTHPTTNPSPRPLLETLTLRPQEKSGSGVRRRRRRLGSRRGEIRRGTKSVSKGSFEDLLAIAAILVARYFINTRANMPRKESSAEDHAESSNRGTSARTRPLSFEEIMLRRKKKLAADSKGGNEVIEVSRKVDGKGDGRPDSDKFHKSRKNSNDVEKGSSKRTEGKDKGKHDLGADTKVKSRHSKSSRDKEHTNVKSAYHKTGRLGADSDREHEKKGPKGVDERIKVRDHEKNKHKERDHEKNRHKESDHEKNRHEERDHEKNRHEERDTKSRKDKRKHPTYNDEKGRSDFDSYSVKNHDLGRNDRKKEYSEPYDERRSKRRRSRSPEYDRGRDRSISASPRTQKRSHQVRDYGSSPYHSYRDKSRRNYADSEKHRTDNGDYSSEAHWKHGSGLGGYSPRKRKTEAAVRTPSPTIRSPERKNTTWDQPPTGTSNSGSGSALVNLQSPATKLPELVSSVPIVPATTSTQPLSLIDNTKILLNPSIDSVQLTQATRPMRRIYIENLSPSASEKTVIDGLNEFLMLPGANYIQRIKPCISCIINKDKSQALVEFLTPEDATKALSFDGRSLSGSVVKIRRPKDFVETTTRAPEKPVAVTNAISDVVTDTPHKIFVGGISKALSSDMLVEIVSAFGLLRAYHFEFHQELDASVAFLEYADHSITPKACAGLNGIKLGGRVVTAVQAYLNDHEEKDTTAAVSYVIPDHAKPLLADPTTVLQLKNVFNRDEFMLLSEADLEEALEDIRLECARFGTIKSMNVVRHDNSYETAADANGQNLIGDSCKNEAGAENGGIDSNHNGDIPPSDSPKELQNVDEVEVVNEPQDYEVTNLFPVVDTTVGEESLNVAVASKDSPSRSEKDGGVQSEIPTDESALASEMIKSQADTNPELDNDSNLVLKDGADTSEGDGERMVESADLTNVAVDDTSIIHHDVNGQSGDPYVFEPGCVLVEYSRAEASCIAAHCLHGRSYGAEVVTASYVPHDIYRARFRR